MRFGSGIGWFRSRARMSAAERRLQVARSAMARQGVVTDIQEDLTIVLELLSEVGDDEPVRSRRYLDVEIVSRVGVAEHSAVVIDDRTKVAAVWPHVIEVENLGSSPELQVKRLCLLRVEAHEA